jgi:hypothetical protein
VEVEGHFGVILGFPSDDALREVGEPEDLNREVIFLFLAGGDEAGYYGEFDTGVLLGCCRTIGLGGILESSLSILDI